ncbi:MAG: hypothetical protein ACI39Q_03865, partial [Wujia sp.]
MKVRMSAEQQNLDAFVDQILRKYHFLESDREKIIKVYEQMKLCMGPYAAYRINQKVTGIPAIDDGPAAIVAMTLGAGVDRLQEHYVRNEQLDAAYILDCLADELLLGMYAEFNASYARFHRRYVKKYIFIGNEIPVAEIPELLRDIKGQRKQPDSSEEDKTEKTADKADLKDDTGISAGDIQTACDRLMDHDEITANTYGVMSPSKSVVFYAALSENPNQACEGICTGCGNTECENRVTAEAVDERYQKNNANSTVQNGIKEAIKNCRENSAGGNLNYGYQRIFGAH